MILSLLLIAFMAIIYFFEGQKKQEHSAAYKEYESRTAELRAEQNELRLKLTSLKKDVAYYGEKAKIAVGFTVTDENDISYIKKQAEIYGFSPVIVLDCTMDSSRIAELLYTADMSWETMLYIPFFDNGTSARLISAKASLESLGRKDCGIAFYRTKNISADEIAELRKAGFIGYTFYHDSPVSGQGEDGTIYLDFSYITGDNIIIEDRLSKCYSKNASMMYIFDMNSIRVGNVAEENADAFMRILAEYSNKESCSFSTVSEAATDLLTVNQKKAELEILRDEQADAFEKRIDELERMISEIYNECLADIPQ